MSEQSFIQANGATEAATTAGGRIGRLAERAADVSMDPAQQSLADALRITFRVIQFVMVLLVALFLFSGIETISEGESGIRLRFGEVQESNLTAGQQFHLPYPIGELVTVSTGQRTLRLDRSFYPDLTEGQRARGIESQAGTKRTLKPGVDGSLITGDFNIAHTDWTVVYSVDDAFEFTRNLVAEDVDRIVRAAVERGVVHTIAGVSIDDLLRQSAGGDGGFVEGSAIENRVRDVARASLESVNAGIRIERVTLNERIPPLDVYNNFQSVSTAEAQAASIRENALREARQRLTAMAGAAHEAVLSLIDDYELALASEDVEEASRLLQRIDRLIDGERFDDDLTVSGEVTRIVNGARQYRTDLVASAQGDAARFSAKLQQYRANPEVFVATEWKLAFEDFLEISQAEIFPMPPDSSTVEIILNSDPELARRAERDAAAAAAGETIDRRLQEVRDRRRRDREQRGN